MSSAELGISVAKMIRAGKVKGISCTGANLEEDIFNLVVRVHLYSGRCCCGQALISAYSIVGIVQAHTSYERVPAWRHLSEQQEEELYNTGRNRVTDTCIPEEEAFRRVGRHLLDVYQEAEAQNETLMP